MSRLRRFFGGKSARDWMEQGDELFGQDRVGEAKLAYDRALESARDESLKREVLAKIDRAQDAIAVERLKEAARHHSSGHVELALEEALGALEVARSDEIRNQCNVVIHDLDRADARKRLEESPVPDEEEQVAALAASWEEEQAAEYDRYGEPFFRALLDLQRGEPNAARRTLEHLIAQHEDARFLWLDVARARLACGDENAAVQAFRQLIVALEPATGLTAQIHAHLELSEIANAAGNFEDALAELERLVEALPDDPRGYFLMGRFLRSHAHTAEAIDVLEAARDLMDPAQPDWRVFEELGLALVAAGRTEEALQYLESVIDLFARLRSLDFPVHTATALARLYEDQGRKIRAVDMYRALAGGSDRNNLATYCQEAARLLIELDMHDEAERMRARAEAVSR